MAKAILAGTMSAYSLNMANPTPTDLAEHMLWAARDFRGFDLCLIRVNPQYPRHPRSILVMTPPDKNY